MVGVYGPRQSERRVAYSEQGRISCDVKLATFASRQRGVVGQVRRVAGPGLQGTATRKALCPLGCPACPPACLLAARCFHTPRLSTP